MCAAAAASRVLRKATLLCLLTFLVIPALFAQATFQQRSNFTGQTALSLVSDDLNGDGIKDVAVAAYDDRAVVIHYGNADGSYRAPLLVPVCGFPKKIVSAKLNSDGLPDLVTLNDAANVDGCEETGTDNVSVIAGRSDGVTPVSVTLPPLPQHGMDIAAGRVAGSSTDQIVVMMSNSAVRTIFVQSLAPLQYQTRDVTLPVATMGVVALGDFTGDGKADLVAGICCNGTDVPNGNAEIYSSNGDGTWGAKVASFSGQPSYAAMLAADINNDGRRDLVMARSQCSLGGCAWDVSAFLNNGNGGFNEVLVYLLPDFLTQPRGLVIGDFTGDGRDDIAFLASDEMYETGGDYLLVVPQKSDGTFGAPAKRLLGHDLGGRALAWTRIAGTSSLPDLVASTAITNELISLVNTTDATGGLWCNAPDSPGIDVCLPRGGASVVGDVRLFAAATVRQRVYRFEVWEGGTKLYTQRDWNQIDTTLALSNGPHTLTVVARNQANDSRASKTVSFTVSSSTAPCPVPATNGINVCSPADGSTVPNDVIINAAARVSGTVYRFELWVDGVKLLTARDAAVMQASQTLPAGTHRFDFVAYNEARTSRVTKTVHATVK